MCTRTRTAVVPAQSHHGHLVAPSVSKLLACVSSGPKLFSCALCRCVLDVTLTSSVVALTFSARTCGLLACWTLDSSFGHGGSSLSGSELFSESSSDSSESEESDSSVPVFFAASSHNSKYFFASAVAWKACASRCASASSAAHEAKSFLSL